MLADTQRDLKFRITFLDKLGWRKTKPSQKQGIRLNVDIMLRLIKVFRSYGIFGGLPNLFLQNDCPLFYSPPDCLRVYTILQTKLSESPAHYVTPSRNPNPCRCANSSNTPTLTPPEPSAGVSVGVLEGFAHRQGHWVSARCHVMCWRFRKLGLQYRV